MVEFFANSVSFGVFSHRSWGKLTVFSGSLGQMAFGLQKGWMVLPTVRYICLLPLSCGNMLLLHKNSYLEATPTRPVHLSNEKKLGWLGYIGDGLLPSYLGIIVNHYLRIPIN